MNFVLIFGPQAVGKMTVGQELEKITGLRLFHNHMTIELVSQFFSYGTVPGKRLVELFRQEIFEEVSRSELPGLIFTYVWALDQQSDWDYVKKITGMFEQRGGTICYVELEAGLNERLERNRSPHRLMCKPTKRNIEWSDQDLLKTAEKYRLNSFEGEFSQVNYLKLNNTTISPEDAAILIKERFQL